MKLTLFFLQNERLMLVVDLIRKVQQISEPQGCCDIDASRVRAAINRVCFVHRCSFSLCFETATRCRG